MDTSGEALQTALKVRGVCIKVNAKELGEALGTELSDVKQSVSSARKLGLARVRQVAITFGGKGAILVNQTEGWKVKPPKINMVNSVGSGDALLGAMVFALWRCRGRGQRASFWWGRVFARRI
ncbi:MAG TPA: PfkB family carbohydrate kinase [Anaerolineales bacterium]|nr:PfkB family carbohydrate kinase [Anaerolineales bacterium]